MTDCAKCKLVAEARAESKRLRSEVERLVGADRARVAAALAGVPVTLSDAEIADVMQRVYSGQFEDVVRVPVEIALSTVAEDADRLRASQIVVERLAGKVTDKLEHTLRVQVDLSRATDEEIATLERAQQIIARLSGKVAG